MKFLIQTEKGHIVHDFSFQLVESIKFNNWFNGNKNMKYKLTNETEPDYREGYIPIGSVEFVTYYIEKYFNRRVLPANIPDQLNKEEYTGRIVSNIVGPKSFACPMFVKSNDKIKGKTGITQVISSTGTYQVSEVIEIDSEWRCFIYRELEDIRCYSGDFRVFPDIHIINKMIIAYNKECYTLDVGIVKGRTVIIEVHDFFSCGLYGFNSNYLPHMFAQTFNRLVL